MKLLSYIFLGILTAACCSEPKPQGPYFGETTPGDRAKVFAPGVVNDGIATRDITFSPDGKSFVFGKNAGNSTFLTLFYCEETEQGWSKPEVLPFAKNPEYIYLEPCFSSDGKQLFFVSNMEQEVTPNNRFVTDIWVVDRENNTWGKPQRLAASINSAAPEFYPTVAQNGNLYFTRENPETRENLIYKSEFKNGKYQTPEVLPEQINCGRARFNATIGPDESFMIVPSVGMPDSYGGTDYYISFFDSEKGWSEPQNMGEQINWPTTHQYSASFSPDGKYLFFMNSRTNVESIKELNYLNMKQIHNSAENGNSCIYWIKTDFITDLKNKATFTKN